jgi:UDP-N-acetylmuramoyl-tripeptide--D-alanyl-D-alanine ligase
MEPRSLAALAALMGQATVVADPTRSDAVLVGPDVVIDSRQVTPGALFVALPGERVDGHGFVGAAADAGAGAALVSHPVPQAGVAQIVVPDPLAALANLARHLVDGARDHLTVIGLTGSSGKTTTKDLLAQVLARVGPTVAPVGSLNNEIGVPLTATRVDGATRYLVSELGSRGPGHITALCDIVRPTIGTVLNIGTAHVGEFGSPAATAVAKGELVECLPPDGWAVLNAGDPWVAAMADRHGGPIAWFSGSGRPQRSGGRAVWASDITIDQQQCHSFRLHDTGTPGGGQVVHLRLPGAHQVPNAAAAAATALTAGLDLAAVAAGLSLAEPRSRWRLEIQRRSDGLTVVNDAYNANPESMRAALATASGLWRARQGEEPGVRLIAVLGDMLELGPKSAAFHTELGRLAAAAGVSLLIAVGTHAAGLAAAAAAHGSEAVAVEDRADVVSYLTDLGPADIVLVKASRSVGLETVAEALLAPKDNPC